MPCLFGCHGLTNPCLRPLQQSRDRMCFLLTTNKIGNEVPTLSDTANASMLAAMRSNELERLTTWFWPRACYVGLEIQLRWEVMFAVVSISLVYGVHGARQDFAKDHLLVVQR